MNNPQHKLSSLKKTKLSDSERVSMREDIVAFMHANPISESVRNSEPARHHIHAGEETSFTAFITVKRKRMITAMLIAMFALSGGVSFAAQGSLPGDVLYPVKIHVNENIESVLAVGAEADAEVARKQLERRAEEAAQLHAEHRLNAEVKAELARDAAVHAQAYKKAEATLTSEGENATVLEVKTEMQTTINAHQEALTDLGVSIDVGAAPSVSASGEGDLSVEDAREATGTLNLDIDTQGEIKIELPQIETQTKGSGTVDIGL